MLGIRHVNGTAIDLWSGNPTEFVADFFCTIQNEQDAQNFGFDQITSGKCRAKHVCAVFAGQSWQQSELGNSVCALINTVKGGSVDRLPRRITMIFADVPTYKMGQQVLFREIPDLELEG
jgi:hypothetical protein